MDSLNRGNYVISSSLRCVRLANSEVADGPSEQLKVVPCHSVPIQSKVHVTSDASQPAVIWFVLRLSQPFDGFFMSGQPTAAATSHPPPHLHHRVFTTGHMVHVLQMWPNTGMENCQRVFRLHM